MKIKNRPLGSGTNTYFHYRYGIFVRPNRLRNFALSMGATSIMLGGFFVTRDFVWPVLSRSMQVQRVQEVASGDTIEPQPSPQDKSVQPIRSKDDLLTSIINDKISGFPADQQWSVFVYDLNTERTVSINADKTYDAASLYKLFLLEALEDKLPFEQWHTTWVGSMTIEECAFGMLRAEDNPCSQELGDFVGWDKINKLAHENGYKNTDFSANGGKETAAADIGELLAKLKRGQILSDSARRFVFDALYQQTIKKGIAKGCEDCRTANKIGELNEVAHDVGIVTHGDHNYVLVVMSKGGSFKQIEEITKLVEMQFAPR